MLILSPSFSSPICSVLIILLLNTVNPPDTRGVKRGNTADEKEEYSDDSSAKVPDGGDKA